MYRFQANAKPLLTCLFRKVNGKNVVVDYLIILIIKNT